MIDIYLSIDNVDPKRLVPVQATGFQDLKTRIDEQDKMTSQYQKAVEVCIIYISYDIYPTRSVLFRFSIVCFLSNRIYKHSFQRSNGNTI